MYDVFDMLRELLSPEVMEALRKKHQRRVPRKELRASSGDVGIFDVLAASNEFYLLQSMRSQ